MPRWIYKKLSDENLVKVYAKGRVGAFECLYARHKDRLYSFIHRQCSNSALAEDIAQDVWLAVIRNAKSYQPTAKFVTWLFRIAHNRLIDHWRKFGATANVVTQELPDNLASGEPTADHLETLELINLLSDLPEKQLATLLLNIEGFSRDEIAEITCANPETVKSRLRYARNTLRENLELQSLGGKT